MNSYFVTILFTHLVVLTIANPFHKYPFVFLLDVGNEELEKTNSEQIRLLVPGGSLALRYPAVGDGDTIAHIRVTGLDFGTDLKANIYDGGPGYKYVVLVFSGNLAVPYDAVVTIQTISDERYYENQDSVMNNNNIDENKRDSSDNDIDSKNDSEEDLSDDTQTQYSQKIKSEIQEIKSNYYNTADNNNNNYKVYEDEPSDTLDQYQDTQKEYKEIPRVIYNQELGEDFPIDDGNTEDNETEDNNDLNERNEYDSSETQRQPVAQKYVSKDYMTLDSEDADSENTDQSTKFVKVDSNLYKKYEALMPHLYDPNIKIYSEEQAQEEDQTNSGHFDEDPVELDQMFNDEEIHNDAVKFKDSNNNNDDDDDDNYYDSDDNSAVAY